MQRTLNKGWLNWEYSMLTLPIFASKYYSGIEILAGIIYQIMQNPQNMIEAHQAAEYDTQYLS